MKRGFATLFLLILLVSPMILAQEETPETTDGKVDNVFQRKVTMPSFKFLYAYKVPGFTLNMTWVELTLYLMASAIIFVAALEILSYTAFEIWWTKALIAGAALAVTIVTGAVQQLVNLFHNFLNNFRLLAWGVVILVIAALLIKPIIDRTRKNKHMSKAEELGTAAGAALKGLKKTTESAAKSS